MQKFKWEKNHGKFIHEWLWRESLKMVPALDTIAKQLSAKFINDMTFNDDTINVKYIDKDGKEQTATIANFAKLFNNDGERQYEAHFMQPDADTITITTKNLDGSKESTITLSLKEVKAKLADHEKRIVKLEGNPVYDLKLTDNTTGAIEERLTAATFDTNQGIIEATTDKGSISIPFDNPDQSTLIKNDKNQLKIIDSYLDGRVDGDTIQVNAGKLKVDDNYLNTRIDNKTIQTNNGKIFVPQKSTGSNKITLIKNVSIDDPTSITLYAEYYPFYDGGILTEITNGGGQLTVTKDLPVGVITTGDTDLQLTGSTAFMLQSTTKPANKYLVQVFNSPSLGLVLYALQTIPTDTYKFTDQ